MGPLAYIGSLCFRCRGLCWLAWGAPCPVPPGYGPAIAPLYTPLGPGCSPWFYSKYRASPPSRVTTETFAGIPVMAAACAFLARQM